MGRANSVQAGSGNIFMTLSKRSLWVSGLGAVLLCAGFGASAQDAPAGNVIGPPQLKDFSLQPRDRPAPPPAPPAETPPAVELAPPSPVTTPPAASRTPATTAAQRRPARETTPRTAAGRETAPPPAAAPAGPAFTPGVAPGTLPAPVEPVAAAPAPPATVPPATPQDQGSSYWLYAIPAVALALFGVVMIRRRRNGAAKTVSDFVPVAAAPPKPTAPRADPIPRPWLELSLKAERASFEPTEAVVMFELEISNTGGSPARNLRIDVKMINAGVEQDREIGSFFKTAGRDSTKLQLPGVEAGVTGVLKGSVRLPVDEMKAVRLDERLLFIPVIAVNMLYDWGNGRSGQTSKSYVVGRELQQSSEKMGAFRVDQGPRIWRQVGQRAHNIAKRV